MDILGFDFIGVEIGRLDPDPDSDLDLDYPKSLKYYFME